MARPRRHFDAERGLDGVSESDAVGDGAVAGGARGKPCRPLDGRARHQRLDALVHVAEPLFEPHHGLARGGEAEVSRLDDAGMHRADGNLMQASPSDGQEVVGGRASGGAAMRVPSGCCTSQKPRSSQGRVSGAPTGSQTVETMNGAFEPDRRRVQRADRRECSVRTFETATAMSLAASSLIAMCTASEAIGIAPQPKQRRAAGGDFGDRTRQVSAVTTTAATGDGRRRACPQ